MTLHAPETLLEALGFIVRRRIFNRGAAVAAVSLFALGGAWQAYADKPAASSEERLALLGEEGRSGLSLLSGTEIDGAALTATGAGRHGGALFRSASELSPAAAAREHIEVAYVPRVSPGASRTPGGLRAAPLPDAMFSYADQHPTAPRAYAPRVGGLSAGSNLGDAQDAPGPQTVSLRAKEGDTLLSLLLANGVSETEANVAVNDAYGGDPRRLREGDRIDMTFVPNDRSGATLQKLSIFDHDTHRISMRWLSSAANFWEEPPIVRPAAPPPAAASVAPPQSAEPASPAASLAPSASPLPTARPAPQRLERVFQAAVEDSIYETGISRGLNPSQIAAFVEMFRHSVDFERDIRRGDRFEILFDRRADASGALQDGPILYAALVSRGKRQAFYRFEREDGRGAYFDEKGESNRRAIIRTPVEGRVSSRFGNRRHPISGYTRMHQGVDFAAPSGTPIIAAGDGVVARRGWVGGYGNYIEIKHNNQFTTAYAHMSRFNDDVKKGSRVRQGQIIGYVGSTGNSTGPHLHFEVVRDGQKIDPMKLQDIGGLKLEAAEAAAFKTRREAIDAKMRAHVASSQ